LKSNKEKYMHRAIRLAEKGSGWVNPNPMVGALLFHDHQIHAVGFHHYFGGPHAEADLFSKAGKFPDDSTLVLNLEPCNHMGKTPPCAPLIVEKGIKHVIVGMPDPDPQVNGNGIAYLLQHGVDVEVGVLEKECRTLNEVFIKYKTTGLPFILLKWAMTLDGKIATVANASRWITGDMARKEVHRLRQRYSAVLVGVNTVISDNPLLNTLLKTKNVKHPLKIVADTTCRIPIDSKVLTNDPQLTIVAVTDKADKEKVKTIERMGAQVLVCPVKDGRVDLSFLMQSVAAMGIDSVMIEGGSTIAFSALNEGIVDKVIGFVALKILGGEAAPAPVGGIGIPNMDDAINVSDWKIRKMGNDLMIEGYIQKGEE